MSDNNFLSRWSRLKRRGAGASSPAAVSAAAAPPPVVPRPVAAPTEDACLAPPVQEEERPSLTLQDAEALTGDSDFRPFLLSSASDAVHRAALRKLWMSDPIITAHDGLTDYADDYTFKADLGEAVRTAWRNGQDALARVDVDETAGHPPQLAGDARREERGVAAQASADAGADQSESKEAPLADSQDAVGRSA